MVQKALNAVAAIKNKHQKNKEQRTCATVNFSAFTYAGYGQSWIIQEQSIQPGFIRDVAEDNTTDGIGNTDDSDEETGVLRVDIQIESFILRGNQR